MSTVHTGGSSESMESAESAPRRHIALVSVSIDLGAGRRGVDTGPSAIRIAGLTGELRKMGCAVHEIGTVTAEAPEITEPGETRAKFLAEITQVCRETHDLVAGALGQGFLPLILGGDHSLSVGTVSAVANHYGRKGSRIGLLWVDAHTDMNTPGSTPSGNVHGMSLAVLTGEGPAELVAMAGEVPAVRPENVCVLGARSIDPVEKELIRTMGVRVFTMSEVDERGMAACMDEALERLTDRTDGFHLSLDLDAVDPMVAPGVGTPVAGGLTYREAHLICEKAALSGALVSLEVVELNPVLDSENRTGRLAVGLVTSALGKSIL